MMPPVHFVQNAAPVLAAALVASLWQGVLLTAGVWLTLRLMSPTSAAVRSALWSAVLLLVLCLPVLELFLMPAAGRGAGAVHAERGWGWALLVLWGVASVTRAAALLRDAVRLRGAARRATLAEVPFAVEALLLLRGRRVAVRLSEDVNRPSVMGLWQPRILLPPTLFAALSQAELEQVVLHEMEHLRRCDHWMNLLQQISLVLLPLHPAMLWLDRRLCRERELACDDGVLRATRARKAYAACLVKLAEDSMLRRGVSAALSALGARARQSELVGRVRRILTGTEVGVSTRSVRLGASAAAGVAVLLAGVLAASPEVVSFDGAPAAGTTNVAAAMRPAWTRPAWSRTAATLSATTKMPMARPVLARAVLTSQPLPMRQASMKLAARPRPRLRAVKPNLRPSPAPRLRKWAEPMPVERQILLPAPRMTFTEMEIAQPFFAAVPWRNGWLIVQL